MKNGWVVIGEAKTGKAGSRDLDTLVAVAELIGGNAVLKFFVINELQSRYTPESLNALKEQAEMRRIKLFFAEDLEPERLIDRIKERDFVPV